MKLTLSAIFVYIFANVSGENCSTNNFEIVWQESSLEAPKNGRILDTNLGEAKVVKAAANQNITKICSDTLIGLPKLQFLTFNGSGIREIEAGSFKNTEIFTHLDLTRNYLERVTHGVFNGLKLTVLQLGRNKIKQIDDEALDNMVNLLVLDLSFNEIEELPTDWLKNCSKIYQLYLENNRIRTLGANVFKNLRSKRTNTNDKLLSIYLENNDIGIIHEAAFDGLEELNKLSLHGNKITVLNGNAFSKIIHINAVTLKGNQIECIANALDFLSKFGSVTLDNNPWNCFCLEQLQDWYDENDMDTSVIERLECH